MEGFDWQAKIKAIVSTLIFLLRGNMIDIFKNRRLIKHCVMIQKAIFDVDAMIFANGPDSIEELLTRKQKLEAKYEEILEKMKIESKKLTELFNKLDEYIEITPRDRYTLEAYFRYNLSLVELETSRKINKLQLKTLITKILVQLQDLKIISTVSVIDMQELKVKNKIKE